jgi:hypothetical protein
MQGITVRIAGNPSGRPALTPGLPKDLQWLRL